MSIKIKKDTRSTKFKLYLKFLLLLILFTTSAIYSQTPNRTVNFTSTIAGATNYSSLTSALSGAASGTLIWVAAGTYKETEIVVPAGVVVVGGFPVNATSESQRIYPGVASTARQSILDANYEHRVATVRGVLDGFILTKGYAYDATSSIALNAAGGGVLIDGGIVQNCIVENNMAAKRAPSPTTIPGSYVASIGDIYYKGINGGNDTIVKPVYTLNNGNLTATLVNGFPDPNKAIAQGVVFYIDPASTNRSMLILGRHVGSGKTWSGSSFTTPLPDISSSTIAKADMNGKSNTQTMLGYVNDIKIPAWNVNETWRTRDWNSSSAFKYVEAYDVPTGTLGEWYLPSAGEMVKLTDVYLQMEAAAKMLGWGGDISFSSGVYWTSNEIDESNAWTYSAWNGYQSGNIASTGKGSGGGFAFPVAKKTY